MIRKRVKIIITGIASLVLSFTTACYTAEAEEIILIDDSGKGNNGIVVGNVTFIPGKFGSAIHFNNAGDHVKIDNSESLNLTHFTTEAWFKLDSLPSQMLDGSARETYYLIEKSSQYYVEITPSEYTFFVGTAARVYVRPVRTGDEWIHWTCTFNGKEICTYINGELEGSTKFMGEKPALTENPVKIGTVWTKEGEEKGWFKGAVDEVKIWERALTPEEIKKRYEENKALSPEDLAGSWSFDEKDRKEHTRGWKRDVTIYDKPGWSTSWIVGMKLLPNDEIILQCESYNEKGYYEDFYSEEAAVTTLSSKDGGLTWQVVPHKPFPDQAIIETLDDGTIIQVAAVDALPDDLEKIRRAGLKKAGLGHLAEVDGYLIFPESMAEQLKAKGYGVFDQHPAIPEGQAAVYTRAIKATRSTDGGNTWTDSVVTGAPVFGDGPVFWDMKFVRLPDGTILASFCGTVLRGKHREIYVVRSTDQGKTWRIIKTASVAGVHLAEPVLTAYPDGRVVVLIRGDRPIYEAISDNGGLTWGPTVRTAMKGYPLRAILLKNGNILCTYGYREVPGGARASISYDRGETWDLKNEIILRDDIMANHWISPAGPHTVQLSDGTIFSAYNILRVTKMRKGDVITDNDFKVHRDKWHCYLAGSRYTEDYVRPVPWKKK